MLLTLGKYGGKPQKKKKNIVTILTGGFATQLRNLKIKSIL